MHQQDKQEKQATPTDNKHNKHNQTETTYIIKHPETNITHNRTRTQTNKNE